MIPPSFCYRSQEGVESYRKIGVPYPEHIQDQIYDEFIRKTRDSPSELNQNVIYSMTRVQSNFVDLNHNKDFEEDGNKDAAAGEKPREYIIFNMSQHRLDALQNEISFTRSNIGMYEIPIPHYAIRKDSEERPKKFISGIDSRILAYSIPFTKTNAEKIRKEGGINEDSKSIAKENTRRQKVADKIGAAIRLGNTVNKTRYYVTKEGDRLITVNSFEDWKNGTFEELWNFGRAHISKQMWEQRKAAAEVAAAQRILASGGFTSEEEALSRLKEAENRNKTAGEVYT